MLVHEYEQNNKINSLDLREKSYVQLLIKELNDYSKLVIKKTPKYILHIVHVVRILDSSSQPLVNTCFQFSDNRTLFSQLFTLDNKFHNSIYYEGNN